MSPPQPKEWILHRPQVALVGEGVYARAMAQILHAVVINDETLRNGSSVAEPMFSAVSKVVFVQGVSEALSALLWRHERLWSFFGEVELRCLIVGPNESSVVGIKSLDVLGRSEPFAPFGEWNEGYAVASACMDLDEILQSWNEVGTVSYKDWRDLKRQDHRRQAIRQMREALVTGIGIEQALGALIRVLSPSSYEWEAFCPPPQHRHANAIRKWLSLPVTSHNTQWIEEGKKLLLPLTC